MPSVLPKAVQDLTQQLTRLPTIGPKTARRLALHLLRQPPAAIHAFAQTLQTLHERVQTCSRCFSLSETPLCPTCQDATREQHVVCVVEDALDVEAIEQTGSYRGLYHVLGGVLSPMEGIDAAQLTLQQLFARINNEDVTEIIIALGHTMESDATTRYITAHLQERPVVISRLARGLPTGGDIEFADTLTLLAAFEGRKKL
jgi:recombination protein RecR